MGEVRDLVTERRRHPATCLYCASPPDSEEHALPHAMGGRLRARILCRAHNNAASHADNVLSTWFAPWTQMLMVPKQGGDRGTSFVASADDGRMLKMEADGRVVDRRQVVEKDERGRILHAEGSEKWIRRLQAAKAASGPGPWMPLMVVPGGREHVTVSLGLTRDIEPGLVKTALHFIAAFMDDVVVRDELRDVVLLNRVPDEDGVYVRPLRADSPLFGESWPPTHEITAYPGPDGAYVTIMLYGVFGMVVRLPGVRVSHALRYVQHFDRSGPMLVDVEPRSVPWDSAGISRNGWTAFFADLEERLARIDRFNEARIEHDLCVRAARAAHEKAKTFRTGFLDLFRAELDLFRLPPEKKDELVKATCRRLDEGFIPWKIPTSFEPGGPSYGDIA